MAWSTIFANLAGGNQNLSLFDTMFNQVAQMVAIPSSASGVNAIQLNPIGTAPALANYQNFSSFRFVAGANSTGSVTLQYQTLGFLPAYLADGATQVGAGNIVASQEYVAVFIQALNAGGGGFILEAAAVPAIVAVAGGVIANLQVVNNSGTPNTQVNVSYDECVMNNNAGGAIRATAQSFICNTANIGVANGIDAGSLAASTWYAVWGISNGSTAASLISASFSAPTLPSGYTFKKRLGAVITDGSNHFMRTQQNQRRAQYVITPGGNTTTLPVLKTGTNAGTMVASAVAGAVPPTAIGIGLTLLSTATLCGAAPNATYTAGAGTNPPAPLVANAGAAASNALVWFALESTNVYFFSTNVSNALLCFGWEDNI